MPYVIGTIGKRSLLSLVLIILDSTKHQTDPKDTSVLAKEERGEILFAVRTAESLLKWMGMTVKDAKKAVEDQVAYYLGGEEVVEIPAVPEGGRDVVFPSMDGIL
jgi:hypothetical protein